MNSNDISENEEETSPSNSEDSSLKTKISGILDRATNNTPFGGIILGIIILSGFDAFLGYNIWLSGYFDWLLYFAILVTILGSVLLIFLSFCILSRSYLNGKVKIVEEQISYFDQVKKNAKNLFNTEIFQNTKIKSILVLILTILALFMAVLVIGAIVFLISVLIALWC